MAEYRAMEIELWVCEYRARCAAHGCDAPATTLLRFLDEVGRFIRQVERCDKHLDKMLAAGGLKLHHRRTVSPIHS